MKVTIEILQGNGKVTIESENIDQIIGELKKLDKINSLFISENNTENENIEKTTTMNKKSSEIPTTPVELIKNTKAKTTTDKIMIVMYHFWKHQGVERVNTTDVRDAFKSMMEPRAKNFTAMMNHLSSKGFITPDQLKEKKKAWRITRSGMDHVQNILFNRKK